jgi:hypothetical protein
MRSRFVLRLIIAAVLWPLPGQAAPAAADPCLFVSFVRLDSPAPIIYPPQQLTLAVQVATSSVERVPAAALLNTTARGLRGCRGATGRHPDPVPGTVGRG